ncbi:hypothetical protein EJ06DRAFT_554164 [Trichodelitschia bisporula]|uniref:C3H1-type domain-containing protein n=1 Tax=Trichodelitschia bisporula TaxID=703511 RepID=A0A6G1I6P2_9PEZI|nr:hypothetical protein EJ06DRAFT_554164 [Trichodelitschia bisporula]
MDQIRRSESLATAGVRASPAPKYYLMCDNGTAVPLYPAGEQFVSSDGIMLTVGATSGVDVLVKWKSMGTGATIDTRAAPAGDASSFNNPSSLPMQHMAATTRNIEVSRPVQATVQETALTSPPDSHAILNADPASNPAAAQRNGVRLCRRGNFDDELPDKKVWCSHWLRYDMCLYTTQGGCRYRHEFPPLATFEALEMVVPKRLYAYYGLDRYGCLDRDEGLRQNPPLSVQDGRVSILRHKVAQFGRGRIINSRGTMRSGRRGFEASPVLVPSLARVATASPAPQSAPMRFMMGPPAVQPAPTRAVASPPSAPPVRMALKTGPNTRVRESISSPLPAAATPQSVVTDRAENNVNDINNGHSTIKRQGTPEALLVDLSAPETVRTAPVSAPAAMQQFSAPTVLTPPSNEGPGDRGGEIAGASGSISVPVDEAATPVTSHASPVTPSGIEAAAPASNKKAVLLLTLLRALDSSGLNLQDLQGIMGDIQ